VSEVLTDETVLEEPTAADIKAAGSLKVEQPTIEMLQNPEGAVQVANPEDVVQDPDAIPEVADDVARLGQAALQIAMQMRQILETGEQVVMLLVKPDLAEKFELAFRAVPENILPGEFISKVPVMPDPECDGVRIIIRADLIREFLLRYYGPVQDGGNGLLQSMEDAVSRIPGCPVRVDLKALELLFLLEIKERVKPGLIVPTGASLRQGLPPNLRQ
jgi:hypothetical protein